MAAINLNKVPKATFHFRNIEIFDFFWKKEDELFNKLFYAINDAVTSV